MNIKNFFYQTKNILEKINKKIFFNLNIGETINSAYKKSKVRFIYRTNIGVDIFVHPDKIQDILLTDTSCDAENWIKSLSEFLPSSGTMIDVGANIGIVSCWLALRAERVYAFEPDEKNQYFLRENIALNGLANVDICPTAVGAKDGSKDFFIRESFGHHSFHKKHISRIIEKVKVPVVTLDSFCINKSIQKISLLKIDVEGSEFDVLFGFRNYLAEKKVSIIVFEHAPVLYKSASEKIAVYDFLSGIGYSVYNTKHEKIDRHRMLLEKHGDFYAKHN